jgi:hypothetical protein
MKIVYLKFIKGGKNRVVLIQEILYSAETLKFMLKFLFLDYKVKHENTYSKHHILDKI